MIQEVTDLFKNISERHQMLKSFLCDNIFEVQKSGDDLHPQLFLETPFSITYTTTAKDISFAFYITDIPSELADDKTMLLSKVEQINDDILAFLQLSTELDYLEVININSLTLDEWMGDNCVAIRTDITLRFLRDINRCFTPFL